MAMARRHAIMRSSRMGGMVKRYHTWPTLNPQDVAAHSFHVLRIYRETFGQPPADVVDYIVYHDVGELWSGDPPFPVKLHYPDIKSGTMAAEADCHKAMEVVVPLLTALNKSRTKACDLLEMMEFGIIEVRMGNGYAMPIIGDTLRAALEVAENLIDKRAIGNYVLKTVELLADPSIASSILQIIKGEFTQEDMDHVEPD